jgi:hypothetical protein
MVRSYADCEGLLHESKLFVVDAVNCEFTDEVPQLSRSD